MNSEEEAERARQAAAGMEDFMKRLTDAIDQHKQGQKDPGEQWDEHDYEKLLRESDARADKYADLLDKYRDSDEVDAKIAKEMGWDGGGDKNDGDERTTIEEINAFCEAAANEPLPEPDPRREGIDWIRTENGDVRHPLQHRCIESAVQHWRQAGQLGLGQSADNDLNQFIFEFQTTGAKLAGALNGIARQTGSPDAAFTVACLKRALDHLHKSQAGLEALAPKKLLPEAIIAKARKEFFDIRLIKPGKGTI